MTATRKRKNYGACICGAPKKSPPACDRSRPRRASGPWTPMRWGRWPCSPFAWGPFWPVRKNTPGSPPPSTGDSTASGVAVMDNDDEEKVIKTVGADCLYVNKKLVESLGIKRKGKAFLTIDPNNNRVVINGKNGETEINVDSHYNSRVAKGFLEKAGAINATGELEIRLEGNDIVIEAA